jgi:hypothetical protein
MGPIPACSFPFLTSVKPPPTLHTSEHWSYQDNDRYYLYICICICIYIYIYIYM